MSAGEDLYDGTVKVLGDYVAHHVKEEEEDLFPKVERADMDLQTLGRELATRKQQLTSQTGTGQDL